jgi:hypothetical protein
LRKEAILVNFERAEGLGGKGAPSMLVEAATANHQTLTFFTEEPVLRHSGSRHLNESYWRVVKDGWL